MAIPKRNNTIPQVIVRSGLEWERCQRDLYLWYRSSLACPYTLSQFAVLWLVQLSLFAPFFAGVHCMELAWEMSCSETQLPGPDVSASDSWHGPSKVRQDELIGYHWILSPSWSSVCICCAPCTSTVQADISIHTYYSLRRHCLGLICDWANLWASWDFSLEISCSTSTYTMVYVPEQAWLHHSGLSINVTGCCMTLLFICYLDASKAFDKLKCWVLFDNWLKKGMPAIVIRLIVFWYTKQTFIIR